jgi:hypothetical protein
VPGSVERAGTWATNWDAHAQPLPLDFELSRQACQEPARRLEAEVRAHVAEQRVEEMAQRLSALEEEMRRLRGEG